MGGFGPKKRVYVQKMNEYCGETKEYKARGLDSDMIKKIIVLVQKGFKQIIVYNFIIILT